MDIRAHVVALNERRLRINHEMQAFVDDCIKRHPGEPMSAEETEQYNRYNTDIDAIDAEVRTFVAREESEREAAQLREAHAQVFGAPDRTSQQAARAENEFRAWIRGEVQRHDDADNLRSNTYAVPADLIRRAAKEREMLRDGASADEIRLLVWDTGSIASAVPTTTARTLYQKLEASIAMFRAPTYKFPTASGETMKFPKINAHGIATQVVAQGTAIGGTDPTFLNMTLDAFKYGQLVDVSSEVLQDTVFPVEDFLTGNIARAVGRVIDADLAVGTGTAEPQGLMTATTGAGTIATGGSLIDPTYEKLIDLVYSVNDEYRASPAAGWLMRDSTAGTLRKLRSGNGGTEGLPLWQPSVFTGLTGTREVDALLGFPVYTDPNVASLASNARIIGFGDFSAYYIRQVGDFMIERSDDFRFDVDEVSFRGKWRVDGDLIESTAWNIIKRSV